MQLIQAKVRCVEGVRDTGWFVPGRETTVFYGPRGGGKSSLLQALQTLNPPYDIHRVKPFADHPRVWKQNEYDRRVVPEKKTAVFFVFSARAEQVVRLADIDADLIETDRIEIGRRLDNSRWTSFVELSASSRWREIAEDMSILRRAVADWEDGADTNFFEGLGESDRLQGDAAADCSRWLQNMKHLLPDDQHERYQRCLYHIQRRQRFYQAEEKIAQELPLTLYLSPGCALPDSFRVDKIMNGMTRDEAPVVTDMLSLIYQKYDLLRSGVTLQQLQAEAQKQMEPIARLLRENGWPIPVLSSDSQGVYFTDIPKDVFGQRLYLVALTCLLAQLGHGARPVLLLDCFDHGMAGGERLEIIRFQQRLGSWCQLLVATADEGVAGALGWQSVFRLGPGGLRESGLVPF